MPPTGYTSRLYGYDTFLFPYILFSNPTFIEILIFVTSALFEFLNKGK